MPHGLFWAYVAVIVVLSLVPTAPELAVGGDKLAHFGAYGLMALLRLPWAGDRRRAWYGLLLVCGIGGGVELAQGLVPYRTGSAADFVADVAGATLGTGAVVIVRRRWGAGRGGLA